MPLCCTQAESSLMLNNLLTVMLSACPVDRGCTHKEHNNHPGWCTECSFRRDGCYRLILIEHW